MRIPSSFSSIASLLLQLLFSTTSICQESNILQTEKANATWYIFADLPTLSYSTDQSFLECNIIQGFGGGFECLFNGKFAIGIDLYRDKLFIKYNQYQLIQTRKGWRLTPTFKLYLDSYKKLSLNIGTQFLLCQESINNQSEINSQKYWQNTIRFCAGYKMYMFKKKNLGVEMFIGTNLLIWGNSEPWTSALSRRGMIVEGSLFYKFN